MWPASQNYEMLKPCFNTEGPNTLEDFSVCYDVVEVAKKNKQNNSTTSEAKGKDDKNQKYKIL